MSLTKVGGVISASLNGLNYPVTTVEYLVVAGGGGAGFSAAGGGGAGGLLTAAGFSITLGSPITVTVGAGGTAGTAAHARHAVGRHAGGARHLARVS
jgi:hypothetical protein